MWWGRRNPDLGPLSVLTKLHELRLAVQEGAPLDLHISTTLPPALQVLELHGLRRMAVAVPPPRA